MAAAAPIRLQWTGGQCFAARSPAGSALALDGESRKAFSPTQALLASVAACMGIDVVLILQKMREGIESLAVEVEGNRMEEPPRYFRAIDVRFRIGGSVSRERAGRAVQLSLDRYCSVFHTLRKDIEVRTSIEIEIETAGPAQD
jgi:putative redox protein